MQRYGCGCVVRDRRKYGRIKKFGLDNSRKFAGHYSATSWLGRIMRAPIFVHSRSRGLGARMWTQQGYARLCKAC
eukprot:scaffold34268_cov41-Tisochrysis_lutea.AAC.1